MTLEFAKIKLDYTNSKLRELLGENALFYIGVANTLILIAIGSLITYTLAIGGEKAELAVISASVFGVAAATVFYFAHNKVGPTYNSGKEDSIVFVLTGSLAISVLPVISTDLLELSGPSSFMFFIGSVFFVIVLAIVSIYLTVFKPITPENEV